MAPMAVHSCSATDTAPALTVAVQHAVHTCPATLAAATAVDVALISVEEPENVAEDAEDAVPERSLGEWAAMDELGVAKFCLLVSLSCFLFFSRSPFRCFA